MTELKRQNWRNLSVLLGGVALIAGCMTEGANVAAQSETDNTAQANQADQPASPDEAGWDLVFEDDFERDELGENWEVVDGSWEVADGQLRGSGTLVSAQGFPNEFPPGFQRLEFTAVTDVKPLSFLAVGGEEPEVSVSDISSFIHAKAPEEAEGQIWRTGYFFQFGGYHNTQNRIRKSGNELTADTKPEVLITPDQEHHIVVENDEGHLRFFVDDQLILEYDEKFSIMSEDNAHLGFYFYTAAKIDDVKVYLKRLPNGLDTDVE